MAAVLGDLDDDGDEFGGYGNIALVALEGVPDSAAPGSTTGTSP
jgi:hypothetical protein